MGRKRHTPEQIITAVREAEVGLAGGKSVKLISRELGITEQAAVALALGVVGIYGVISYVVSQRTREIGVRMVLGADSRDVRRMVLRQGVILTGIGVAVGLVAAVGLTRLISSWLFGVEAMDPLTFGAVAALLTSVALVASYLPARRASRTDPLEALRFV